MSGKRPTLEEIWLRNAGFAVADDSLDPALRRQMAAALRLELKSQQTAAAEQARLRAEADARANPGQGRPRGTKNKKTLRREALFDDLYRNNPDCSSEEIRTLKGPKSVRKMGKSTVARHWTAARERAGK